MIVMRCFIRKNVFDPLKEKYGIVEYVLEIFPSKLLFFYDNTFRKRISFGYSETFRTSSMLTNY